MVIRLANGQLAIAGVRHGAASSGLKELNAAKRESARPTVAATMPRHVSGKRP
jgi:hypothetical protein